MFDGVTAFTLYDTYGFPLDLTQDALRPRGIGVDIAAFTDAMEQQREKARASWAGSGETADEAVWFALRENVGATDFLGYETESAEGVVTALVRDGKEVSALKQGESGAVVLNQTPFYGESGGQVGDTGEMRADSVLFKVTDTQKYAGDVFAHVGIVEKGTLIPGMALALKMDHRDVTRSAKITRRRICCMRRCAKFSAITWRKRDRWSPPTACVSISPIRSP